MKAGWKGTEACWEVEPSLMTWIQVKKRSKNNIGDRSS